MESIVTVLIALVAVEAGCLILNALIFSRTVFFEKKQETFQEKMLDKKGDIDRLNDMVYQLNKECFGWREKYQALESAYSALDTSYKSLMSSNEFKPKTESENVVKEAKEEVPSKRTRKRTTTSRKKV